MIFSLQIRNVILSKFDSIPVSLEPSIQSMVNGNPYSTFSGFKEMSPEAMTPSPPS